MTIPNLNKVYPRSNDYQTVYLKNVITRVNIKVGDGAIIGTRAVVTKDVPPYTIVGGIPSKVIKKRYSDNIISKLLKIKWWDWSYEKIQANIPHIQSGNIDKLK